MKCIFRFLVISISLFTVNDMYGQCGNNGSHGPNNNPKCPDPPTGDPFNPYTGNEHREVIDIEVWGGVGEIPLTWKRYYNSREFTGWSYSFQYMMADDGTNSQGQPQVSIWLPEGGRISFAKSVANPNLWLGVPGVQERIFQDGNNFFLQMANGHRYRFRKITNPEGSFYQLQDIRDQFQNIYTLTYSGGGYVSRITEPAGRYIDIAYVSISGQELVHRVTTSDGRAVQYNYNTYNDGVTSWPLLTSVQYGDGTAATYEYHPPHYSGLGFIYLAHAIDPRYAGTNVNMRFTYDSTIARGYIKEEINGKTGEVMATLSGDENNRWVCYANGRVQHLVMPTDFLGKTTEYTDGLGRTRQLGYDANGFIATEIDPLGRTTSYLRTVFGNSLQITYPDGSTKQQTRNELDLVLSQTDELGRVTSYTRDNRYRITGITFPDGNSESFTYNTFGQVLTHTLRNGGIETNVYDARGLKTSYTDALGNITFFTYDAADRLATITDERGNITRYEYNERGLVIKLIQPDNSFALYVYDEFGNQVSFTNEIGNTWQHVFDEFKRMLSTKDPLNRTTAYSYNLPNGGCGCAHDRPQPTLITLPSGKKVAMEYDAEWQKIKQVTGVGTAEEATIFYEYNELGKLIAMIDPRLKTWGYGYDLRDRLIIITDPLGSQTTKTYNAASNLVKITRPDNAMTLLEYDEMNRVTKITDPKSQITQRAYDSQGNMVSITDQNGNITYFEYDLLNRQVKMIYPGGSFETSIYDETGNRKVYSTRSGIINTYTYDNRNRQVSNSWSDGTPGTTRIYDAAGRLINLSNGVSSSSFAYNEADELVTETQNIQGAVSPREIHYTRNVDGMRQSLTYPGASLVLTYDYSARNQVAGISGNGQLLSSYGYDAAGNLMSQFKKNGVGSVYVHDDKNRITSLTHHKDGSAFSHYDYGYDNLDRRNYSRKNWNKGDVYMYDAVSQLVSVQYDASDPHIIPSGAARTVNYTYDAAGNRIQENDNGATTGYTTNSLNQYTQIAANALSYNGDGQLQNFNGWIYGYDAQGRLISASKDTISVNMMYDARNRCVKRVTNGIEVYLYYDNWRLIEETNAAGGLIGQYIHGIQKDELILKSGNGVSVFYHQDIIGNVTELTDSTGSVIEQYVYDVFGRVSIRDANGNSISSSAFNNRFLFTGRELIQELDLYDYRNRVYSSAMGRFLQPDPISFQGEDLNLYRYVENNSINMIDPDGNRGFRRSPSKPGKPAPTPQPKPQPKPTPKPNPGPGLPPIPPPPLPPDTGGEPGENEEEEDDEEDDDDDNKDPTVKTSSDTQTSTDSKGTTTTITTVTTVTTWPNGSVRTVVVKTTITTTCTGETTTSTETSSY